MNTPRRPNLTFTSACGQRGVALVEVLISILIFSFGVLGLLALEARAITYSTDSEDRNRAAMFANEVASDMWIANSVTLNATLLASLNTRVANMAQGGVPGGTLTITPVAGTTNSAKIVVAWQAPQHTTEATGNQVATLVTLP